MAEKVQAYADRNYQLKKNIYDAISQAFTDLKHSRYSTHHWNKHIEKLDGITLKFLNNQYLSIQYARIELGTTDTLARTKDNGNEFLKEIEKELKKGFKKLTKKGLKLKKVKEDQTVDKYSHLQADNSWIVGSSRYGGGSQVGKYLVRDMRVYEINEDVLDDE